MLLGDSWPLHTQVGGTNAPWGQLPLHIRVGSTNAPWGQLALGLGHMFLPWSLCGHFLSNPGPSQNANQQEV